MIQDSVLLISVATHIVLDLLNSSSHVNICGVTWHARAYEVTI